MLLVAIRPEVVASGPTLGAGIAPAVRVILTAPDGGVDAVVAQAPIGRAGDD